MEAVETAIWLTEVAPNIGQAGRGFLDHLENANNDANPELSRLALKLATGAGKTTVMAMLIAWQTINAVRRPQSSRFTRGFLVVTPGITIKDRLRVLQPNDPDSYYQSRELVPSDMLPDLEKAKIVITNSKRVYDFISGFHRENEDGSTTMACERITAAITRAEIDSRPVKAVLDPYNPVGSTAHVNFTTSRTSRWQTDARRCHINWVVLDSDWEAEFCRVVEAHPRVKAYTKNHNLGLEVPYRYGSETRTYIPDFVVLIDDGRGADDLLHLIVEIKGYRREDAKEKKATMDTYWVPGVNNHGRYGRWAFAEFTDVYEIESEFEAKMEAVFDEMIEQNTARS